MTRNMVWLTALLAQFWLEHGSYEPGVAGSSPARSNIFFMFRANRLVVNATSFKPTSFGFAGSNPASRKFNIHINNNFRVIINFYYRYNINTLTQKMSLRSFLQKFPKYGDFIAFFCFLVVIFVLSFRPNKTLFDYFLIVFNKSF
jgi:hypothetical protein